MKIMAEQALLGIPNPLFSPTILRFATVFGYSYRPRFDLIVNLFAKNAFFRNSIEIFGGTQWRPNIHVSDVARAIIKTLEAPMDKVSRQIYNVGNDEENHNVNGLANLALEVFPETRVKRNKGTRDPRNYKISCDKIRKEIGYSAEISVRDGLKELRAIFEKGEIKNPDESFYSNIESLKEFVGK